MKLRGNGVIVTEAMSGLGAATARLLAASEAKVVLFDGAIRMALR